MLLICILKCLLQLTSIIQSMQREKPPKGLGQKLKNQSSEQEEGDSYQSDGYQSSFVVNDDSVSDYGGTYHYKPRLQNQHQDRGNYQKMKERKRNDKRGKKSIKKKLQESFDQDDLDLIDEANNLVRLKKNFESKESQEEEDLEEMKDEKIKRTSKFTSKFERFMALPADARVFAELDSGSDQEAQIEDQELQPKFQEIIDKQCVDPFDGNMTLTQDYKQITETDLPQYYIYLLKKNLRGNRKDLARVRQYIDLSNLYVEGGWMFDRLKQEGGLLLQTYDEKLYKKHITNVIQCFHREHLDPMYIFFYRKMLFKDYVNLQLLWKIIQLDDEWQHFRQRKENIVKFIDNTLPSYTQVPESLKIMAKKLLEIRELKYFQDFQRFKTERHAINTLLTKEQVTNQNQNRKNKRKLKSNKAGFITQLAQRGIIDQLESNHIVLTPQEFCENINKRSQQKKPKSPQNQPKDQFQTYFNTSNPQSDKIKYPLLVGENRYKIIIKYLTFELFSYTQIKKILWNRYYKKLVITTHPTNKGNQDIDLYNNFFPVKRIRQKPVNTLKRQVWILAREAQKLGHIKIDLKFQWQKHLPEKNQKSATIERDVVYLQLIQQYYDMSSSRNAEIWNIFRKRIISNLLYELFIPYFLQEIRLDLNREGQNEIISACCSKLKSQLSKGPALQECKPIKILALVIEEVKLGIAFVDQAGKPLHILSRIINNEFQIKNFAASQQIRQNIKQYYPDLILIAANCKKAEILHREMQSQNFQSQKISCVFGEYQIPRLIAKKKKMQGYVQEQIIMQAISMARLKKNPIAEIVSLWSQKLNQNGILSMDLHPYQKFVNQLVLKDNLQKVIIEMINIVGLDINQIKKHEHLQYQVQFVSGLGPSKAKYFLEKLKEKNGQIMSRQKIQELIRGSVVHRNCSPFFKVQTSFHRALFEQLDRSKKGQIIYAYESLNLLDMTRITIEWYDDIEKVLQKNIKFANLAEVRTKKQFTKLSDENAFLLQMLKNTQKIRKVSNWKVSNDMQYDQQLIISQLRHRFKDPRDRPKQMESSEIFFNLLRETPDTFRRFMIMPVKVISVKKNFLYVIEVQSGLFGSIKLQSNKSVQQYERMYEKGTMIKAILVGFPFDEKKRSNREKSSHLEPQRLKVEMSLDFPHKGQDFNELMRHNCMKVCFPFIVKQLHPIIDLEKDRFDLRREDRPILEKIQEKLAEQKPQPIKKANKRYDRRVSHLKFKNISIQTAIQLMKTAPDGDYVIRPSSQGPDYLTITWKFFGKVIVHIKIRCEQKSTTNMKTIYRIEDKDSISYESLEEILQKRIKPMNLLVQDVTLNRKFLNKSIEQIVKFIKEERKTNPSKVSYYLCVSEDFPQYFLLIYEYKDKQLCKELVKVKSSGLSFHEKQFPSSNQLLIWFKEHLKEKEYQNYVKNISTQLQLKK